MSFLQVGRIRSHGQNRQVDTVTVDDFNSTSLALTKKSLALKSTASQHPTTSNKGRFWSKNDVLTLTNDAGTETNLHETSTTLAQVLAEGADANETIIEGVGELEMNAAASQGIMLGSGTMVATNTNSISIGHSAQSASNSVGIGFESLAQSDDTRNVTIGAKSVGFRTRGTAIGYHATSHDNAVAIGHSCYGSHELVVTMGRNVQFPSGARPSIGIGGASTPAMAPYVNSGANVLIGCADSVGGNGTQTGPKVVGTNTEVLIGSSRVDGQSHLFSGSGSHGGVSIGSVKNAESFTHPIGTSAVCIGAAYNNAIHAQTRDNCVCIGSSKIDKAATAFGNDNIVIGSARDSYGASVSGGSNNIVIGTSSNAFGNNNLAVGYDSQAGISTTGSIALGRGVLGLNSKTFCAGAYASSSGANQICVNVSGTSTNSLQTELALDGSNVAHNTDAARLPVRIGGELYYIRLHT